MRKTERTLDSLSPAPAGFAGECPIKPRTWERNFPFTRKDTGKITSMKPAQTRHYEHAVRDWMKKEYGWTCPMQGELRFEAEFSSFRPQNGHPRTEVYSSVKPDIDNFARAFLESFDFRRSTTDGTRLGVIAQGTPIVALSLTKRWTEPGEWPGTRFCVSDDGARGVAFSNNLYDAEPVAGKDGRRLIARASLRRFDELADAPDCYARFVPMMPVPWKDSILYGERLDAPPEVKKFQREFRRKVAADYRLRKPMGGPLILEVEVLLGESGYDKRYLNQWLVLIDYIKTTMDCLDWRAKTKDGVCLGVVENDSRFVGVTASMRRALDSERPGIRFAISPMDDTEGGMEGVGAIFDHIETGYIDW
jgi:Holliday junction resolvase RusA-like endonuclease